MKNVIFIILASVIVIASVMMVSSSRLLRSAVYLLFVLIATAGIYFLLDYTFLAASQLTLYAGGIIVLIIFSVMLTSGVGEKMMPIRRSKRILVAILSSAGAALCLSSILMYQSFPQRATPADSSVKAIGAQLVSAGENGFVLPFEVISLLLLAAMVAAIVIARREEHS